LKIFRGTEKGVLIVLSAEEDRFFRQTRYSFPTIVFVGNQADTESE